MPKAASISIEGNTSFLFKSAWGFGKTLAATSFALGGPVYLAYFDKKKPVELVTFFKKFGDKGKRILESIDYDVYGGDNANMYLNKMIDLSQNCPFFAVITDSVTNLTSGAVNWSLGFDSKGKKIHKPHTDPTSILPGFDEYKVETSLVSQALDLSRTFPCHVIWTAHPIAGIKVEGSGSSMRVSKVNPIVTYGSKVGSIVPGQFTEIYHFSKTSDYTVNPTKIRYKVSTEAIGDDYAKTALGLPAEFDITDRLFYEVWLELLTAIKLKHQQSEVSNEVENKLSFLPKFSQNPTANTPEQKQPETNQPEQPKWRT